MKRFGFTTRIWAGICFLSSITLTGCGAERPYRSMQPTQFAPFELPLTMNDRGVPLVTIETSAGPIRLILDTGADQAVLLQPDSPIIASLEQVGSERHFRADGHLASVPVYELEYVELGPLRFTGVRSPTIHDTLPDYMEGDGMLGRGLLNGLTLDIDGPGGRLGILPPGSRPADFDDVTWREVPLLSIHNGPVVPVQIDSSAETLRMVIDTGAIAFGPDGPYAIVELPGDLEQGDELLGALPVYHARSVRLGDADIGPMRFVVMNHPEPPGTEGFLGNALTQSRRIIIDGAAEVVFIEMMNK